MMITGRPAPTEYNEFFTNYINLAPQEDLLTALRESEKNVVKAFSDIPPSIEVFRYDTNKWSIKELLMHLADYERYLSFKAFVAIRNDKDTILYHPKREHYLFNAGTEKRHIADLIPEFRAARAATISLFEHASASQLNNRGNHNNEVHGITASALGFAIAGHANHHVRVLKERYLKLKH